MKYKELSVEDKNNILSLWEQSKPKSEIVIEICDIYDIKPRTLYDWLKKIDSVEDTVAETDLKVDVEKIQDKYDILSEDKKKIHKLEQENKILKTSLNEARNHVHSSDEIRDIIYSLNDMEFERKPIPEWVDNKSKGKIVPVLCIADIHVGEVVEPADVNYVNEFNSEIASYRINKCVDDFIDIYINKFSSYEFDGMVLNVLGDCITNDLHDLAETNDQTTIDQVIFTVDLLETQIRKLQNSFGKVLVNLCSGNHGRAQPMKYTKNSNRYNNSLEKIVYTFVERNINKDFPNEVIFNTSAEDVLRYSINGHRFQQEHGDKIKTTGTAIAGPSTSFARAYLKKSSIGVSTNNPFQTLIVGHFHNHYYANGVLVANSVKGYDSYCASLGIPFSLPGCTSFAVNSHGQIIFLTDIQIRNTDIKKLEKSIEIF